MTTSRALLSAVVLLAGRSSVVRGSKLVTDSRPLPSGNETTRDVVSQSQVPLNL